MNDKASKADKCPSRNVLEKLISGSLCGEVEASIARHISDCHGCQTRLDSAVPDQLATTAKRALSSSEPIATALSAILADAEADIQESVACKATPANGITRSDGGSKPTSWADVKPWLTPTEDGSIGQLGPYRLTEILGRGGMGIVFRSHDPTLQRPVAIKVLSPVLLADNSARGRFLREARAVAAINHPGIIGIYEVVSDTDLPYFAMELVDGRSLESLLSSGRRFSAGEVTKIGFNVANALAAAHSAGLIHRDIKPANILIESKSGRVRLMDFGLARSSSGSNLTGTGALLGTPSYMAPETIAEQPQDERTDLFSLGAVMYHLLTGQPPFEASTVIGTIQAVARGQYCPIQELAPKTPPSLQNVLNQLLAHKPEDRFQSAADAASALKASRRDASSVREKPTLLSNLNRWRAELTTVAVVAILAVLALVTSNNPAADRGGASNSTLPIETGTAQRLVEQKASKGRSPSVNESVAENNGSAAQPSEPVLEEIPHTADSEIVCLNPDGEVVARPATLESAAQLVPDGGSIKLPARRIELSESIDFGDRAVRILGPDDDRVEVVADFEETDPLFVTTRSLTLRNLNVEYASEDSETDDCVIIAQKNGSVECTNCRFHLEDGEIVTVDEAKSLIFNNCTLRCPIGCAIRWNAEGCEGSLTIRDCWILTDVGIAAEEGLPEVVLIDSSSCVNQTFLSVERFEDTGPPASKVSAKASTFLSLESVIRVESESDLETIEQTFLNFRWYSSLAIYTPTIVEVFEPDEDEPHVSLRFEEWENLQFVTEKNSQSLRGDAVEDLDELIHDLDEPDSELRIKQFLKSLRASG